MTRVADKYKEQAVEALQERFKYKSAMQVPKLEKIVLSVGAGEAVQNSKAIQNIEDALRSISGQKPRVTRAKKSIAAFKVREGMPVGCMVTLRRDKMYDFLDRLISVALPRVRDFRGISRKGFDGNGNYNFGLKDQIVFPEIDFEKVDRVRGMDITFVTSAKTDEEGLALLEQLGLPFRKAN